MGLGTNNICVQAANLWGAVVAASYRRRCRDFARPALDYRIRNDLLFGLLMRIECERPKFRQSKVSAKMAKKLSGTMAFGALQKLDNWLIM